MYNDPFCSLRSFLNFFLITLAPVVQTLDSAIHQINQSVQRITQLYPVIPIRWILSYPLDSVIQLLKNRGLVINWDLC